jgi:uncharacterized protein (DUF302 family)
MALTCSWSGKACKKNERRKMETGTMTRTNTVKILLRVLRHTGLALAFATMATGCGTLATMGKLEEGAGAQFSYLWERWVNSGGDLAATVTWERKVAPGVTPEQIETALASVAVEDNMRAVGELPLSRELEARSGKKEKYLKVYSYCTPATARQMVDFSPHMAAFLPCRIVVLEKEDGLWLYTLNMDMMIKMGRKLPPELKASATKVRDTMWKLMERGARGEF